MLLSSTVLFLKNIFLNIFLKLFLISKFFILFCTDIFELFIVILIIFINIILIFYTLYTLYSYCSLLIDHIYRYDNRMIKTLIFVTFVTSLIMTICKCIKKAIVTFAVATILLILFIEEYYNKHKSSH